MTSLLEEVSSDHFPHAPATLDPDLRDFYLHCEGAELIKQRPNSPYRLLPLSALHGGGGIRTRIKAEAKPQAGRAVTG
jgi:hypothetical protein